MLIEKVVMGYQAMLVKIYAWRGTGSDCYGSFEVDMNWPRSALQTRECKFSLVAQGLFQANCLVMVAINFGNSGITAASIDRQRRSGRLK